MKTHAQTHSNPHALIFGLLLAIYPLLFAPFGINETDGGFLTGLGWQLLSGKKLYSEIIYVRPPLSIWWRAAELWLLPDSLEIMAERTFFYWKVGIYSFLAAAILADGPRCWWLASLGFVVSVHCYPAAAWHTVDGILMSVAALFFLLKNERNPVIFNALAGIFTVAAMLCKQSFFPLAAIFFVLLFLKKSRPVLLAGTASFFGAASLFLFWLHQNGIWDDYFFWTGEASSLAEAWQHGFLDFLDIDLRVLLISISGAALFWAAALYRPNSVGRSASQLNLVATGFLLGATVSYLVQLIHNQSFTVPVSQSRLLFDAAVGLLVFRIFKTRNWKKELPLAALLSVSWMAAVSWGYNFPLLFATPWLAGFVFFEVENRSESRPFLKMVAPFLPLAIAVLTFAGGYQFIYRDGRRAEMTEPLGPIFPKLNGVFTDRATAEKYADLRRLHQKWPGPLAVLPSFPLANYLFDERPPLPLDWESSLETNGHNELIINALSQTGLVILIEKSCLDHLLTDSKYAVAAHVFQYFQKVDESSDFLVFQKNSR